MSKVTLEQAEKINRQGVNQQNLQNLPKPQTNQNNKKEFTNQLTTLSDILNYLKNVKNGNTEGQYNALCPAHDDNKNSLSVRITSDRILLNCHAGCSVKAITSNLNIPMSELFENDNLNDQSTKIKPRIINSTTYEYRAADGSLAYTKPRHDYDNGEKKSWFVSLDGKKGYNGIHYPYNLPAVLTAKNIYFVEGEKCADAINQTGRIATTLDAGAGSPWKDNYTGYFKDKTVIIIPDNDDPGMKYANTISHNLSKSNIANKIVKLPNSDLPEHGDIYDWLKQGHTMDEVDGLPTVEPEPQLDNEENKTTEYPPLLWFNDIQPKEISWYWYPYIRRGTINAVVGTQGVAKSYLMCKIAAMASRGLRHELPLHNLQLNYNSSTSPEATLYLNAEDDAAEDTRKRLELCGADFSKIATVDLQSMAVNFYNPCIEKWIVESKPSLIVFDPVQQFFVGTDPYGKALNMNDSASVRPALTHLRMLAKKYNAAVVLVMHPNKNVLQSALYAAMGSNDFTAAPRSAVFIGRNPEDKEQRIIALTKSNSVPDQHQKSTAYRFAEHGGIEFDGESPLQADDIRETKRSSKKPEDMIKESAPKREQAATWLENIIEAAGGYIKRADIEKAYRKEGISRSAVYRAKDNMPYLKQTDKGATKTVYWYFEGHEPPEQKKLPF